MRPRSQAKVARAVMAAAAGAATKGRAAKTGQA